MSRIKRKGEDFEDTGRPKRSRIAGAASPAEKNEAGTELPRVSDLTARPGRPSQSSTPHGSHSDGQYDVSGSLQANQGGSYFDGLYNVSGSLQQGNIINIKTHGDRVLTTEEYLQVYTDLLNYNGLFGREDSLELQIGRGTCQWLFDTEAFKSWMSPSVNQEQIPVLVLDGIPGSGKSVMTRNALKRMSELKTPNQLVLGFFFDSTSTHPLGCTSLGLYRTLLFQLISQMPSDGRVSHLLRQKIPVPKDGIFKCNPDTLKAVIVSIIRELTDKTVFVFVDALEECYAGSEEDAEDDQNDSPVDILDFICGRLFSPSVDVRMFLSTRDRGAFANLFPTFHIRMEVNNKPDIQRYIEAEVGTLSQVYCVAEDRDWLVGNILRESSNMFLWVKLAVDYIKAQSLEGNLKNVQDLLTGISSKTKKLHRLYENLIKKHVGVGNLSIRDAEMEERRVESLRLFQVVQATIGPLSLKRVQSILEYDRRCRGLPCRFSTEQPWGDIDAYIRKTSAMLIEVRDHQPPRRRFGSDIPGASIRTVQFIHQSVRGFLDDGGISTLDPQSGSMAMERSHRYIADRCLHILNNTLGDPTEPSDVAFFQYAAQFWTLHCRKGNAAIDGTFTLPSTISKCTARTCPRFISRFRTYLRKPGAYDAYLDKKDIPHLTLLKRPRNGQDESLLVLLAFEGCGELAAEHIKNCQKCTKDVEIVKRAFYLAVHRGWTDAATAVWDSAKECKIAIDPDMSYFQGSPLNMACRAGNVDLVRKLLGWKANILGTGGVHIPLHVAINFNRPEVVKVLCDHSTAKPDELHTQLARKGLRGFNAFHCAAQRGIPAIINTLLEILEDMELAEGKSDDNETPMEIAKRLQSGAHGDHPGKVPDYGEVVRLLKETLG